MAGFQARVPFAGWLLDTLRVFQEKLIRLLVETKGDSRLAMPGDVLEKLTRDISAVVKTHKYYDDKAEDGGGELLWRHTAPKDSQMWEFLLGINKKYNRELSTYAELSNWALDNIPHFWAELWDYCGICHSEQYEQVVSDAATMWPRPSWFQGAKLNLAQNLLYPTREVDENSLAVIAVTETTREEVTWKELRERVRECQAGMKAMNLQVGDRVAGYVANHTNALVSMLAATSLGAIWTAVSPDTGVTGALDRLAQVEPSLLFADDVLVYNGKTYPALSKVKEIMSSLPSLKATIINGTTDTPEREAHWPDPSRKLLYYDEFGRRSPSSGPLTFAQLPAEHPVYILYSSGTTGPPKPIVHGAIGTLIQHKKEHIVQSDIRPGDRLCYITTCMWMMWHWLVSGLASGATIVLYNGSPFYYLGPDGRSFKDNLAMPKLIDELSITQFGTSAKYLSMIEQDAVMPRQCGLTLKTLKAVYSTGSPLPPSTFRYVYRAFGQVNLGSISGGTDIISNFGTPSPLNPVYTGEIQVVGLGLAVRAWDVDGKDVSSTGEAGELVCVKPFPSQPIRFWGPTGDQKYKSSYFDRFSGVWAHGDFIRINPRTGGLVMLGRSDGVLNPSGVRFGSAEMYNLITRYFPQAIEDSLCVGRRREYDTDETVVLFVKTRPGQDFTVQLAEEIRRTVRRELSPRHVPGIVDECPDIPVTPNGKKVEVLIKQILSGTNTKVGYNRSVANHECLGWYQDWAKAH